jgi:hypothetical protein
MEVVMQRLLVVSTVFAIVLLAGCATTKTVNKGHEGGKVYADVPVPENYEPYDTPPFKRQDSESGNHIYGRYAYRSTKGLDSSKEVADWFKSSLPHEGWELQTEDVNDEQGTMKLLFKKEDDQLELSLAPDEHLQGRDRFSILIVEMNPQY